jgi:hypothetical protein
MWVMTFHSPRARMLRARRAPARYTRPVHDLRRADQRALIKKCLDDLDVDQALHAARDAGADLRARTSLRSADDYRQSSDTN